MHDQVGHAAVAVDRLFGRELVRANGRHALYGTNKCTSFTFVTDADQVARWIDVVHDYLVQYGVD